MSDSESSYDDSDREEESEDSTLTSSDTDAEVKYLTFPNRGMRWPVGPPSLRTPLEEPHGICTKASGCPARTSRI